MQKNNPSLKTIITYSLLLTIFFAAGYILLSPSIAYQHWDSLHYSHAIEKDGIRAIWANHPLGHVILGLVYKIAYKSGYTGRALPLLQTFNCILYGISVGLFLLFLVKVLKIRLSTSLGLAIILGSCYIFFHFAGTADIYGFAVLFTILSWASFIYEVQMKRRRYLFFSGIILGFAVLAHQFNILLMIVLCVIIIFQQNNIREKIIQVLSFSGVFVVIILFGYIVFGYLANLTFSPSVIINWSRGHFSNPAYGIYFSMEDVPDILDTGLRAILTPGWDQISDIIRIGIFTLIFFILIWGIIRYKSLENYKSILLAALVQCIISWLLILWWIPYLLKIWLVPFTSFVILLGCSSIVIESDIKKFSAKFTAGSYKILNKVKSFIIPLTGIIILIFNLNFSFINEHKPNPVLEKAIHLWANHSSHNDLLIPTNEIIPYLRYWINMTNTFDLFATLQTKPFKDSTEYFQNMREMIDTYLSSGNKVLIAADAVDYAPGFALSIAGINRKSLENFIADYNKEEVFIYFNPWDHKKIRVYKITGY